MKPSPAVAAALLLCACASVDNALITAPRAIAGGAGGTYYCWKERLAAEGDDLVCNWEASAAEACRSNAVMSIAKRELSRGPEDTRRCENGQWLVMVTTK